MTEPSDHWRRVEEVCHAALERTVGERTAFLRGACGDDNDLRREVEKLLAQESAAERFLEAPVGTAAARVMPLATPPLAGRRFGVFHVGALLGSGGMGDVYRARDTRLGRDVALKVLSPEFTADPERLARVEREARLLAALNHPHIAAIYAIEQVDGVSGLILELVEGPTLADRLARGRLSLDETLQIATQIADALEAAHEKGIVHRDLKPGNIKITPDGVVKVLDFGLAKAVESSSASGDPEHSPTLTLASLAGTRAGMVLGTAAYMAPEQARGQIVDRRADIWAFGVVVYEMLTGTLAFDGESTSDVLAALLNKEPDWSALPPRVPARVQELLRLCLAKDRKHRLQAIGDARIFLNAPLEDAVSTTDVPRRSVLGWGVAGLLLLALAIVWWSQSRVPGSAVDQPFLQVDLDTGPDEVSQLAISPDGMRIAFVSNGHLAIRRLDEGKTTSLAGTEGASNPFFSPDGQWVAFFAQGTLKKMALDGGAPVTLCDALGYFGGTWGDDDNIIAAVDQTGELFRVPAVGGAPQPFTEANADVTSTPMRNWPQALPRGKGVLFGASNGSGQGSLRVLTPHDGLKTLVEDATHGRYLASGYLVYHQEGTLFAAPMDPGRLELTGPAVPLVEGVSYANGRANFDLSASGTLVYYRNNAGTDLVASWLGSSGEIEQLPLKPGNYRQPRLAPDGTRLALSVIQGRKQNIWVYDIRRDAFTQLTFGADPDWYPTWTPDGEFLAFRSGNGLAWTRSDGSGAVERLEGVSANATPRSFSDDGKWLAFWEIQPSGETWIVPVERTPGALRLGTPQPQAGAKGSPAISPDGHWLAYTEPGRFQVYVMPFVPQGTTKAGKWPVSSYGGYAPMWSRNGRDLFFQSFVDRRVRVAAYARRGDSFVVEKPRLWSERQLADVGLSQGYDVAPDGTRVLALLASAKPEMFLHVMLNVGSELSRRAPAGGK